MRHRKTAVCHAVQWALSRQMDEALAKAEHEEEQARQEKMRGNMMASMEIVDRKFGLGLVHRLKLGLRRLRGLQ